MAESSWPTVAGSRVVTDDQWEAMCAAMHYDGVIGAPTDTSTCFGDSSGRQVKIRAGKYATMGGHCWYSGPTDFTLSISANSSGSTRIDRVVLGLSRTTWAITSYVKTGTPGAGVAPSLTQNTKGSGSGSYEISLAQVTVANGASSISAANVVQDAPFVAASPIVTTTTTRPSPIPTGAQLVDTDTGQWHWYNSSAIAPIPGAVLKYARLTPGTNLYTGSTESTFWSTTTNVGQLIANYVD